MSIRIGEVTTFKYYLCFRCYFLFYERHPEFRPIWTVRFLCENRTVMRSMKSFVSTIKESPFSLVIVIQCVSSNPKLRWCTYMWMEEVSLLFLHEKTLFSLLLLRILAKSLEGGREAPSAHLVLPCPKLTPLNRFELCVNNNGQSNDA